MNVQSILTSTAFRFRTEALKSLRHAERNLTYIRDAIRAGDADFTHADYREAADIHAKVLRQFNHFDGAVWAMCAQHGIDPDTVPAED